MKRRTVLKALAACIPTALLAGGWSSLGRECAQPTTDSMLPPPAYDIERVMRVDASEAIALDFDDSVKRRAIVDWTLHSGSVVAYPIDPTCRITGLSS